MPYSSLPHKDILSYCSSLEIKKEETLHILFSIQKYFYCIEVKINYQSKVQLKENKKIHEDMYPCLKSSLLGNYTLQHYEQYFLHSNALASNYFLYQYRT